MCTSIRCVAYAMHITLSAGVCVYINRCSISYLTSILCSLAVHFTFSDVGYFSLQSSRCCLVSNYCWLVNMLCQFSGRKTVIFFSSREISVLNQSLVGVRSLADDKGPAHGQYPAGGVQHKCPVLH